MGKDNLGRGRLYGEVPPNVIPAPWPQLRGDPSLLRGPSVVETIATETICRIEVGIDPLPPHFGVQILELESSRNRDLGDI